MSRESSSKKHLFAIKFRPFLNAGDIHRVIAGIVRCFDGLSDALN
jgi:hypothetical protein